MIACGSIFMLNAVGRGRCGRPLSRPIHRSSCKSNSTNFALTAFSEVRRLFVLWRIYTRLTLAYVIFIAWLN
jgi:hypothetical protein